MPMECARVAQLFLIMAILLGLGVYSHAAFLVSHLAICHNLFYRVAVPAGAGVSSGLVRLFFSPAFLLVLVHAVITHILSCECLVSFVSLYCDSGRTSTTAVLAGLRKRTAPTFFKAVAVVGAYVAVFWPAFRLLAPGELDLPLMLFGGQAYLCGTVCVIVVCRLACGTSAPCAISVLDDASSSGFGAMRRRLPLNRPAKMCAALVVGLLAFMSVSMAVDHSLPSQEMATNVVLLSTVVVTMALQQWVYLVWCNKYRPSLFASLPSTTPTGTGDDSTSGGSASRAT